jgi:outer membrane receptor protein involved in Fe transport
VTHLMLKHPFFRRQPRSAMVLAMAAAFHPLAQAQQDAGMETTMQTVEIIGTTPLPGIGQRRNEIAAPVQTAKRRDIERSGALDLGDFMNRMLGSVHVNEIQGNPFQMDVSYRGYTASPLLGTPQGLSVYMDGVRMNQPFGDVVSWDLIPRAAIASMTLMPGSNPLFGLSTLGAALSLHTKNGRSDPGTVLQTTLGSHARRIVEFEHGDYNDAGLNWYFSGNRFNENGWRDDSPSSVRQLFGKLGWQNRATDLKLTLAHADNDLTGNGLQEQRLLAVDRASVYTRPDQTQNRSVLMNLAATHALSDAVQFSGNLYYRNIKTNTFNGDINDDALSSNVYLDGENASNTPFPASNCIAQAQAREEPAEVCNGLINRTHSKQKNHGVSGQLTWLGTLAGKPNRLVTGAGYDASSVKFTQLSQLGYLNRDRSITGVNAFGDGVTGGNIDNAPYDTRVDLTGRIQTWSAFASDTWSLQPNLHLTLSGRHNTSHIKNRDQIHADDDPATLSGDHRYTRFNPAIGLSYSPTSALNVYGGYNESSRAPTSIELGCANPDQPCKLPNAMAGDPPLNQVVTRTFEAGLRGTPTPHVRWNAGLFRAENRDDILFVADNQAGYGYFKNFGETRRQGLELGANGSVGQLTLGAQYTWLDATYQSAETVNGSSNSSNAVAQAGSPGQDGTIAIRAGDKIALIPTHMLKLNATYAVSTGMTLNASMVAQSGALARGNENNGHQSDGQYYLGPGRSAGYAVFNLGASVRMTAQWQLLAQVNNLFDTRYNSGAQLGATGFDGGGNFQARPFGGSAQSGYALQHSTFYAPGAPRQIWVALRYSFDQPGA